jgi:MraZ protein
LWEKVDQSGTPDLRRSIIKYNLEQMFLGQYEHTIDEKGRLTIPVRFRELLAPEGAYVTRGFDHNLIVLTVAAFTQMYRRVNRMSITDPKARLLKRLIFSHAELVSVDRAGRILIPQFLREKINLDSVAVIVGVGDYFEIWSPDLWTEQTAQIQDAEADALKFMDLDLSPGE